MGLDMYLAASRTFPADSQEAHDVLEAAGSSMALLKEISARDPHQDEPFLYLGGWSFESDVVQSRYIRVALLAGMKDLVTPQSPTIRISLTDQGVVVRSTCVYWRKANAIHGWFVDNCQDGVDECEESDPIDIELMALLANTCSKAVAEVEAGVPGEAAAAIAPRPGFFFGSTDLNDWWVECAKHTATEIERVVNAAIAVGGVTFSYQSSW